MIEAPPPHRIDFFEPHLIAEVMGRVRGSLQQVATGGLWLGGLDEKLLVHSAAFSVHHFWLWMLFCHFSHLVSFFPLEWTEMRLRPLQAFLRTTPGDNKVLSHCNSGSSIFCCHASFPAGSFPCDQM